jgi:hypothetical protein
MTTKRAFAARIERSGIRERYASLNDNPGFRCAQSGLLLETLIAVIADHGFDASLHRLCSVTDPPKIETRHQVQRND